MEASQRLLNVEQSIRDACARRGRDPRDVQVMLVTKTVPPERILPFVRHGHALFGENRVQEAAIKWGDSLLRGCRPDFIGHLQTNKVKACLDTCGRIHSVDRLRLAAALDRELKARGEHREVFLQVNSSGEPSKFGLPPAEVPRFAEEMKVFSSLKVTGLMTLALFSADERLVRPCFRRMRQIFTEVQEAHLFGSEFRHLSMGMSGDYEIAVEEGATIVRVGTAVFGRRHTPDSYYWPGEG